MITTKWEMLKRNQGFLDSVNAIIEPLGTEDFGCEVFTIDDPSLNGEVDISFDEEAGVYLVYPCFFGDTLTFVTPLEVSKVQTVAVKESVTREALVEAIKTLDERWKPYNAEYSSVGEFRDQLLHLLGVGL